MSLRQALWAVCGLALIGPAAAQEPTTGQPHGTAYYLVQSLISLAVVIGLILASHYLLRRFGERPAGGAANTGEIEVIDSRPMGAGRTVYLLRVRGRDYLVGSGPNGVGPIQPLSDPAEEEGAGEHVE